MTVRTLLARRMLPLAVLAWLASMAAPAWAQLSPGPLSEAHSSLDGILQCTSCHALGLGQASFKCVDCHTEIGSRIRMERGYHARLVESAADGDSCVACHAEHNGRDFELMSWPTRRDEFDHRQAGYLLEGAHTRVGCTGCHTPENMSVAGRAGILIDLDRSMLGLETACLSCHDDEHKGQLPEDCVGCHDLAAWRPASGFLHDRARFPLTGLHTSVACDSCHHSGPEGFTEFIDIAFAECSDCHPDPHGGRFDEACDSCHNAAGWNDLGPRFDFDHSRTRFPLEGAHTRETCASCHETTSFSEPIPHDLCRDCHEDYHQAQFESRLDGGDCQSCHGVETFEGSTFDVATHQETAYPLVGMHEAVECAECHEPMAEATDYHPASDACLDCHTDSHERQFEDLDGGACESCHTVDGFSPSTYTLPDHAQSRFPLDGAHRAVLCLGCHTPLGNSRDSGLGFRAVDTSCQSCHEDPHAPPADDRQRSQARAGETCETCHETRSWTLVSFDHRTTRFELLGAHRVASCAGCHEPAGDGPADHVQFGSAPEACALCHEDVHAQQFVGSAGVTECETCHASANWSAVGFDHERDSRFRLEGGHEGVACNLCHLLAEPGDVESVRIYAGTTTECAACH